MVISICILCSYYWFTDDVVKYNVIMLFRGSYCNALPVHLLSRSLFVSLHHVCHSPSLPISVLPALWPDTIIVLEEQWLTLMIILIWCIEYSVFIGASVICFDFTKPVKCQVNFKNISQYLSLSLTHTRHTGGVGKNNCTHWWQSKWTPFKSFSPTRIKLSNPRHRIR